MPTLKFLISSNSEDRIYFIKSRCTSRVGHLFNRQSAHSDNATDLRQMIVGCLAAVAEAYAVEVLAYTVLEDCFELVVMTRPTEANRWTNETVARRWQSLHSPRKPSPTSLAPPPATVETWRERLCSFSWFLKEVRERSSRGSREDASAPPMLKWNSNTAVKWLLDPGAVAAAIARVDLGAVMAGECTDFRDYHFASGAARWERSASEALLAGQTQKDPARPIARPEELTTARQTIAESAWLAPLPQWAGNLHNAHTNSSAYFDLLDQSQAKLLQNGPPRPVDSPILTHTLLCEENWPESIVEMDSGFSAIVANPQLLATTSASFGKKLRPGISAANRLYAGKTAPGDHPDAAI